MDVHLLLPETVTISQTDRYDPEPESGQWANTWHLTASTTRPEAQGQFLTVLLPHRIGREAALPKVELVRGTGALGVRLLFPDGAEDVVAFRTAPTGPVECAGVRSDGRVFLGRKDGAEIRRLLVEEEPPDSVRACGLGLARKG